MTITAHQITESSDQQAAFKIRQMVFVQEQGVLPTAEYDQQETTATHFLALADGVPVGTARYRKTDKGVKLERFAVLKEYRNQQVGSHLLRIILEDLEASLPHQIVYLHAQLGAVPFYRRHGFVKVGELFQECAIDHYQMEWHD